MPPHTVPHTLPPTHGRRLPLTARAIIVAPLVPPAHPACFLAAVRAASLPPAAHFALLPTATAVPGSRYPPPCALFGGLLHPPCCSAPFRRVLQRPPCCRCTSPTLSANAPACFLAAVRPASLQAPACRTPGAHPGEPPPRFPVDLGSCRRTPYPGSCPPHAHPPHSRRPQNRPPGRTAARCLLLTPGARCPPLPLPCFKQRPAPTQKPSPPGWQRA